MIRIKDYGGYDIKKLELLGKGIHGRVYRIDSKRCIKIFKDSKFFKKELETLKMAQNNRHFPKLYEWGDNYIVRELIEGIELDKYLQNHKLSINLSEKILKLYDSFIDVGYLRCDAILFHIFVTSDNHLKVIDTARVMKKATQYPSLIIDGLKELGCKDEFLEHVKMLRPELYEKWMNKT